MEKAREATDAANLRAAYAEVVSGQLTGDTTTKEVKVTQKQTGWQDTSITKIGDVTISSDNTLNSIAKDQTIYVGYNSTTNKVTFSTTAPATTPSSDSSQG